MTTPQRILVGIAGLGGVVLTVAAWFIFPPAGPWSPIQLLGPVASGVAWLLALALFSRRARTLGHTRLRRIVTPAVAATIAWLVVGALAVPAANPEAYISGFFWTLVITTLMGIVLIPFALGLIVCWLLTRPSFARDAQRRGE